ncbi:non-hydrolyzing UDP-N-acetylglucosamine 2-epimerase [Paraburkholderia sp. J41]|uniref:non-hydrolyzing UDP-N-acetylglucosamine 2-epimerase n=1 Tax=Paraburkholderia sp. J41 TaxID=2805433 RepID=UPI002AC32F62|nr:UDP-N-acetylglucosamine 2-epimerase (non-hydrolyzing) [Paraburkholderia sp. J41]
MTRIAIVLGTRPEVIKLAPVAARLRGRADVRVISTGQHREMLDQALQSFGLAPDVDLDCMRPGQTLNELSARLIAGLDTAFADACPEWVIVQGDTTTAFCAALAAFHRGIRVAHVEAGLRTGNLASPFPEEANRSMLARIATRSFAPTAAAREHLLREHVSEASIVVTGNTVVDAIESMRRGGALEGLPIAQRFSAGVPRILVTCHRRENFGGVMVEICAALRTLCAAYAGYEWVFPVHLNPAVREPVMRELKDVTNLHLIEPVDYASSLYLISRSTLVVTDSGGIQEEAPTFGVPTVVMRNHTERREGVDAGVSVLAGQSAASIEAAVRAWLDAPERLASVRARANPYGDGRAAERIAGDLLGMPLEDFDG